MTPETKAKWLCLESALDMAIAECSTPGELRHARSHLADLQREFEDETRRADRAEHAFNNICLANTGNRAARLGAEGEIASLKALIAECVEFLRRLPPPIQVQGAIHLRARLAAVSTPTPPAEGKPPKDVVLAMVPLEVLAAQIATKRYAEMTKELQDQLLDAVNTLREYILRPYSVPPPAERSASVELLDATVLSQQSDQRTDEEIVADGVKFVMGDNASGERENCRGCGGKGWYRVPLTMQGSWRAVPCLACQQPTDSAKCPACQGTGTQSDLSTEPDDCGVCGGSGKATDNASGGEQNMSATQGYACGELREEYEECDPRDERIAVMEKALERIVEIAVEDPNGIDVIAHVARFALAGKERG